MSKWVEIKANYYDKEEGKFFINAWETYNASEEGKVIVEIDYITEEVEYLDCDAHKDRRVCKIIKDIINEIRASKKSSKISTCPWCGGNMSGSFISKDDVMSWYCDFCGFDVIQPRKEFEEFLKRNYKPAQH